MAVVMFHKCTKEDDAKKLFRQLALRLHPDCGGSKDLMILLQEAFDLFMGSLKKTDIPDVKFNSAYQSKPETEKIYPDDDRIDVLYELMDLIQKKKLKSNDFVISVYDFYEQYTYISTSQYTALKNILKYATKWK